VAKTKKEAILSTALHLFVKNGIDATSIRSIAQGANTAEGNIYRHFNSKNDLARTIFSDCAMQFREALQTAVQSETDPDKQMEKMVHSIFKFAFKNKLQFSYIMIVNHRKEIITEEMLSKPLPKDVFVDIIKTGVEKGIFHPTEPTITVAWIVGMVQRSFIFIERKITSLESQQVIDETVRAVLRMLKKQ
jgi:AcrR family transcriptional regulator